MIQRNKREIPFFDLIFHRFSSNAAVAAISHVQVSESRTPCNTYKCIDLFSCVQLLQDCSKKKNLSKGKIIHAHLTERGGFGGDILLGNTLLSMYVKCGSLVDARKVFDRMPERDVCSWTVMIAGHSRHGSPEEAFALYHQMQGAGIQPNDFTFSSVISACANSFSLDWGLEIHENIVRNGFQSPNMSVANALVDMYAKCGRIENARQVFDKMPQRDVVSWTTMVAGYAQNGLVEEALELFMEMPQRNIVSWNAVISGLVENGLLSEALRVFDDMPSKNVVSWTAMIAGFVRNGYYVEALRFFQRMQLAGIRPDSKTFASVLAACANLAALELGIVIHGKTIVSEFQFDVVAMNALIDMYAKCTRMQKARKLFDTMHIRDVVSWTTMLAGYAHNGVINKAMELFEQMPRRNVVSWNAMIAGFAHNGLVDEALKLFEEMPQRTGVSWNAMISGCVQNGLVDKAMKLFKEMPQQTIVSRNTIITGLAQTGLVDEALKLFNEMPQWSVVSWNAMIAGFAQNGRGEEALRLFQEMQLSGIRPDSMTFGCILPVCSNFAALEQGMEIHEKVIGSGCQSDVIVVNALIDMYAKSGSILKARNLFDKMHQRNVVSWTAMIGGYAMHGCARESLKLFEQMERSGINPDHITFVCVLSACSHAGLVDEGYHYFSHMSEYYNITPTMDHYNCMVDLLGRAGNLNKAHDFINKMPIKPNTTVWSCLLAACRVHNNIELGEQAAQHLFELDPKNDAPYVLLSNIYAVSGRWNDIERIRKMMKDRGINKNPGCSWIEVNKHVRAFLTGNRSEQKI